MGLNPLRDRLCLVQLSTGDGVCHIVQFPKGGYVAPNLKRLLESRTVVTLFHFARFDLAALRHYHCAACRPVYCTQNASKIGRESGSGGGGQDGGISRGDG